MTNDSVPLPSFLLRSPAPSDDSRGGADGSRGVPMVPGGADGSRGGADGSRGGADGSRGGGGGAIGPTLPRSSADGYSATPLPFPVPTDGGSAPKSRLRCVRVKAPVVQLLLSIGSCQGIGYTYHNAKTSFFLSLTNLRLLSGPLGLGIASRVGPRAW